MCRLSRNLGENSARDYTELHGITRNLVLTFLLIFSFTIIGFGQITNHIQQDDKKKFFTSWDNLTNFPYSNLECSGEPWKLVFSDEFDNPTNNYTWQLSSGNAAFGNPSANPQWVQITSGSSSASFNISTSTDCGNISRTVAFVHTGGWYRISPNPSSNYIYIEAEEDYEIEYSDDNGELTTQLIQPSFSKVTLHNFNSGEQILEQNAYQPVKNMTLDISHLPAGQYVLNIENEHNISTHQIMIER